MPIFYRRFFILFSLFGTLLGNTLLFADDFHVVVVDKSKNQIHLGTYTSDKIQLIKTLHCTLGKNKGDKQVEKDLKTPEGIYFFIAKFKPPQIKKKFGAMALMVNYPNTMDHIDGKTGYDIMLHSTDDPPRLQRDLDSEGCVVVSDDQILELAEYVQLSVTPFLIYDELKPEYLNPQAQPELKAAFEKWLNAWSSKDIETYISSYADNFSFNGMNLKRYKEYKNSLNKKYSVINVKAENPRFFFHPKYNVVSFTQVYESTMKNGVHGFKSAGTKYLYFKKIGNEYKILVETYSNRKEK